MRKVKFPLLIIISILCLHGSSGCQGKADVFLTRSNSTVSRVDSAESVSTEIIVKFKPETFDEKGNLVSESIKAINEKNGLISMEPVFEEKASGDLAYIYILKFPKGVDIDKLVQEYANDPSVVYAEPNYIMRALDKESNAD